MTAGKSKKQKQLCTAASSPYTCSDELAAQELPPAVNGKKNKKKKSKGKEPAVSAFHQASADPNSYDDDLCDEIPSLEEADPPTSPRTGLSPLFESVHVSATTVSRTGNGMTTQVKTQLLATELHGNHAETPCNGHAGGKRSQAMPQFPLPKATGQTGPGMVDEEYWSAFPPHIKTFVSMFRDW
ncbi:hypothetical protein EDD17DRAFT_830813 [Pisolithus thermaeus]|nr:hypothetical protein EDD17DRAFT_830813 [Pisolithus thermaeus]